MDEQTRRDHAERLAREQKAELEQLSDDEVRAMLHELKVQRIAAELQNEELRAAHASLERSRNEFRELFEHAPIGYLVLDHRGIIRRANGAFARFAGKSRGDLVDRAFVDCLEGDDRHVFLSRFRAMFQAPEGKQLVARLSGPARDPRVVRIELSRTRAFNAEQNHHEHALMTVADISDLIRKEDELAASLREKVVLLREIHHRVKNNLQVISSLLSMAADRADEHEVADALENSKARVLAMALVHETLYRGDDLSSVDLHLYLTSLLDSLGSAIKGSGRLSIEREIAPVVVSIDRGLPIGIIVNELVSNAVKHGSRPGTPLLVRVTLEPAGNRARLVVEDDGPGFAPGADGCSQETLGLLLVRILCDQIGATVDYRNANGMRVEIVFPIE